MRIMTLALALLIVASSCAGIALGQLPPGGFGDLGRKVVMESMVYPADMAESMPPIFGSPDIKSVNVGPGLRFTNVEYAYFCAVEPVVAQLGIDQMDCLLLCRLKRPASFAKSVEQWKDDGVPEVVGGMQKFRVVNSYHWGAGSSTIYALCIDDHTTLFGTEVLISKVVENHDNLKKFADEMESRPRSNQFTFDWQVPPTRKFYHVQLLSLFKPTPSTLRIASPSSLFNHFELKDIVRMQLEMNASLKKGPSKLAITFDPAVELDKVEKKYLETLEAAKGLYLQGLGNNEVHRNLSMEATVKKQLIIGQCFEQLTPRRQANSLVFEYSLSKAPVAWGRSVLAPDPMLFEHIYCAERLQTIGEALLKFEAKFGRLPTQASVDKNGKKLLSWRVHLLPFLGEQELYQKFKLDEPWDSKHNKRLLASIPPVFTPFDNSSKKTQVKGKVEWLPETRTPFLMPVGKGSAFNIGERLTSEAVKDSKSQTIMLINSRGNLVPWTQPEDIQIDAADLIALMSTPSQPEFGVLMWNVEYQLLSQSIDQKLLKALLTIDGGEEIPALP